YTGKIGLIGPSLTDYAHIKEVLGIRGVDFSITSLRACPTSSELVELLKGHKSISIAPEAGTERMRKVIKIRRTSKRGTLVLSISTFVPKPLTPFQWHAMEPLGVVKERLKFIKKTLRDDGNVKVFHDVPKY